MSTLERIVESLKQLPANRQQEILDFVEFLRSRTDRRPPGQSPAGLWSGFDVSAEEIDDARREMWSDFPRDVL